MDRYDLALHAILADPKGRNRWLVLADLLEEGGYWLGGQLRAMVTAGLMVPTGHGGALKRAASQRELANVVTLDPDFGPRADVLREGLAQADRIGRVLRGR